MNVNAHRGSGAQSVLRLHRELRELTSNPNPYWTVEPLDSSHPFEWHFTICGPKQTEFEGGVYHGRIIFPQSYPMSPPSVIFLTINGRFEVGKKVCLSASNYHPELWQPAWGIRTLLDAIHAFFNTPGDGAVHSLDWPPDVRRDAALTSPKYKCDVCGMTNAEIVAARCTSNSDTRPAEAAEQRTAKDTMPDVLPDCSNHEDDQDPKGPHTPSTQDSWDYVSSQESIKLLNKQPELTGHNIASPVYADSDGSPPSVVATRLNISSLTECTMTTPQNGQIDPSSEDVKLDAAHRSSASQTKSDSEVSRCAVSEPRDRKAVESITRPKTYHYRLIRIVDITLVIVIGVVIILSYDIIRNPTID